MAGMSFGLTGPYRWRTELRARLPWFLNRVFAKGNDCEVAGGSHRWYNIDGLTSGCYYCQQIREGQLWKKPAAHGDRTTLG